MPTIEDAIRLLRQVDAEIAGIEAEANAKTAKLKANRSTLEVWLLKQANEQGVDSFKPKAYGTVYWTDSPRCSVADWDSFWKYVQDNEAYHLLTHAASKVAVSEIVKETGLAPPGLNYSMKKTLCVRKPTATAE